MQTPTSHVTPKLKVNIDSDINLPDGKSIIWNNDTRLDAISAIGLAIRNLAQSSYRSLYLNSLCLLGNITYTWSASGLFRTKAHNDATVSLQSYTTGAYQTAAQLIAGQLDIPRCGNLNLLSTSRVDCTSGQYAFPTRSDTNPIAGSAYYSATLDILKIYDGAAWKDH